MIKNTKIRFDLKLLVVVLVFTVNASGSDMVDHFTDNGFGTPLSTMQHPSAEHYEGITYIAYQGPHEDPYLCAYNHESGEWSGPVKAGTNPMGKDDDSLNPDNHGRPAMVIDSKGYIHVVFGGHGGDWIHGFNELGAWGKGKQIHAVSKYPKDISSWEVRNNISPFGTYSQFVKMDNGDIYLFYRHGSHKSDWVYQKSTDDGETFEPPISILKHKAQPYNIFIHDSWYAWFDNGNDNTITATYIYHPCGFWFWHTKDRINCYYMRMSCNDDTWNNVEGRALLMPMTKERADLDTLIRKTGTERSNRGTCRVDNMGHPHTFFRQGCVPSGKMGAISLNC